jgi:hypothetical protein
VTRAPGPDDELDHLRARVRASVADVARSQLVWHAVRPGVTTAALGAAEQRRWLDAGDLAAIRSRTRPEAARLVGEQRLLRRLVVAERQGHDPGQVHLEVRCPRCCAIDHGPTIVGVDGADPMWMSTSSTSDRVAVVVTRTPAGIDLVRRRDLDDLAEDALDRHLPATEVVRQACPPDLAAPELWAAVEALAKTTSLGLDADADALRQAVAIHRLLWAAHDPGHVSCLAVATPLDELDVVEAMLDADTSPAG